MSAVILSAQVLWAPDYSDIAVLKIGQGRLIVPRQDLSQGDLIMVQISEGTEYSAFADDPQDSETWIYLCGPLGAAAITAPRGTAIPPRVSISLEAVAPEVSEGFDLDPDTSDPTVPAAGAEYPLELPIS